MIGWIINGRVESMIIPKGEGGRNVPGGSVKGIEIYIQKV